MKQIKHGLKIVSVHGQKGEFKTMRELKTICKEITGEQEKGRKSGIKIARLITEAEEGWETYKTLPMVADMSFQQFLGERFGYSKGTISKLCGVTKRFLSDADPREEWELWNVSQLIELLTVDDELITMTLESGELNRNLSCAGIRKLFETMKALTVEEQEAETADDETEQEETETAEPAPEEDAPLTRQQVMLHTVIKLHSLYAKNVEYNNEIRLMLDEVYNFIADMQK